MSYEAIASKFRRALRNGTGASFTLAQLREMASAGILNHLAQLEAHELCSRNPDENAPIPSPRISGLTSKPSPKLTEAEATAFIDALGEFK